MSNANALHEGHVELVNALREKVMSLTRMSMHADQFRNLKDATTAYVMAVDKLLSFSQATLMFADRSWITPEEAMNQIHGKSQTD